MLSTPRVFAKQSHAANVNRAVQLSKLSTLAAATSAALDQATVANPVVPSNQVVDSSSPAVDVLNLAAGVPSSLARAPYYLVADRLAVDLLDAVTALVATSVAVANAAVPSPADAE